MGEKKATVRTLKDGTKVVHHPDGTQVMVPTNTLADKLVSDEPINQWLNAEKTHGRIVASEEKRASQIAGTEVPSDKRVL